MASADEWAADELFVYDGDELVEAPADDRAVLAGYSDFADKGPETDGYRLTILTRSLDVAAGKPCRIIHVVESTGPEALLFPTGPKPVLGELVDELPVTEPAPDSDPLEPASYDGRAVPGPGVDARYEITEYRFEPGSHTVQWHPRHHTSNVLRFTVAEEQPGSGT